MQTLRWLGPGTYTDNDRRFTAVPGSEHDLSDDQAKAYLSHSLFSDRWERVDDEPDAALAPEAVADTADDDATPDDAGDDLTSLTGVGDATAENLATKGFGSFDAIREASVAGLAGIENLSEGDAESLKKQLADADDSGRENGDGNRNGEE